MKRNVITGLLLLVVFSNSSFACTLWGAVGTSVLDGGTLIAKNRDWKPDHEQILKKVKGTGGSYSYFGIYAEDEEFSGFKAGINEKNLVVLVASASSIPKKDLQGLKRRGNIVRQLLEGYSSVEQVLNHQELFEMARPMFYMIADNKEVASIEIDLNGRVSVQSRVQGYLAHTNHYLDKSFSDSNIRVRQSSLVRYKRIEELLAGQQKPWTMEDFKTITQDEQSGPDNSIFRTGSKPESERTLASWVACLPASGFPELFVRVLNPGQEAQVFEYKIDVEFWK